MKVILNSKLLPGLLAKCFGNNTTTSPPASADLLKDAAVRLLMSWTGAVLKMVQLQAMLLGAAAGAAVSATHNRSNRRMKSVVQDAAVGAVTNVDWRGP